MHSYGPLPSTGLKRVDPNGLSTSFSTNNKTSLDSKPMPKIQTRILNSDSTHSGSDILLRPYEIWTVYPTQVRKTWDYDVSRKW